MHAKAMHSVHAPGLKRFFILKIISASGGRF